MRKIFFIIIATLLFTPFTSVYAYGECPNAQRCYDWAIVGAGFAGITALAVLIDSGIDPSTITWIDAEFNVGRVGKYYCQVPGNVQTQHLTEYVEDCPLFKDINSPWIDKLYSYPAEQFQPLQVIVNPLLDFTVYLQNMVIPMQDTVASLTRAENYWELELSEHKQTVHAQKVILAIGAHPKTLDYDIPAIPLDSAFDTNKLMQAISADDTVAVFGSMHSAILILKLLCERCSVNRIINFYARDYFHGSPGLEGATSLWAENVLEKQCPEYLIRVLNTQENREQLLPLCTKVIYAIGYEANKLLINGSHDVTFDENSGIIDENLYGIGIAFPPTALFDGHRIAKNGLYAYLVYAKKLIPRWISNDKAHLTEDEHIEIPWI